ncbi:MAG: hypothetical protein H6623_01235 [Bdellovibrionaceae bacterium]|nr:hypothetical protein [Pseudobdellovibrionaceae bacterium]
MILASAHIMGIPRLGDDALLYVSKGVGFYNNYSHGSKMENSLNRQYLLATDGKRLSEEESRLFWRVANQVSGGATFSYDWMTGLVYKYTESSKWTFAVMEIIVTIFMTFGIGFFLWSLWGEEIASLTLLPLSFILLPAQGIHYLIPSTLALSIGFYLIARSLKSSNYYLFFMLSLILAFLHNVAYVWISVAACVLIARIFMSQIAEVNKKEIFLSVTALLFPMSIKILLVKISPFLAISYSKYIYSSSGFLQILQTNILGFLNYFAKIPRTEQIFLSSCGVLFFVNCVRLIKANSQSLVLIDVLFVAVFVTSFFVNIPYYNGEVSVRMYTALSILLIANSLDLVLYYIASRKKLIFFLTLSMLVMSSAFAFEFVDYVQSNFNRPYVFDEAKAKKDVQILKKKGKPFLLLETEYSLRLLSILEADQFNYFFWPLIQSGSLDEIKEHSVILAFPVYRSLVTQSFDREQPFGSHFNGISMNLISEISIIGNRIQELAIDVEAKSETAIFEIEDSRGSRRIIIPSKQKVRISTSSKFTIKESNDSGALVGINMGNNQKSLWPWGQEVKLFIKTTERSIPNYIEYDFSLRRVLQEYDAQKIERIIKNFNPIDDSSGIVFGVVNWK